MFAVRGDESPQPIAASPPEPVALPAVEPDDGGVPSLGRWEIPDASRGAVPPSLRGTDVGGRGRADADGRLVPDRQLRRLFDYFLAASGEEPLEVIRGRILRELAAALPGPAAEEGAELLDRYLAMRQAFRELRASGLAPDDLERRLQWVRELRREHLGAEVAAAFYEEEEAMALVELERRAVLLDESLSEEERAERIEALEDRLPAPVREARRRAGAASRAWREVEALRASGASEDEIFSARERHLGRAAAERLAERDRARRR